ncbi:hypothetical protein OROHE_019109 [Orobanche hederae]
MMRRTRASAAAAKSAEPEKPVEIEEQVELGSDEMEETLEEEIEYEEVEEEVEEEEEEEEEVEEVEEEEDEEDDGHRRDARKESDGDDDEDMENAEGDEELKKNVLSFLHFLHMVQRCILVEFLLIHLKMTSSIFVNQLGKLQRIMKGKDSNENKGYAFVTFRTKELASKAIKELNSTELKGKKLKCSSSQAKHKLFIGNVPRNWEEDDMKKVVNKVGPGVVAVELLKDPQNSSRNRGFAFIEYYNNACAEYSRQKMSTPKFKLDENAPTVSWADPKNAESSSSQVKAVYVKNLPKDITQDQLKDDLFEHHGKITKVVLPPAKPGQEKSRYGFIHFADRSSAMKALKNTEKYEIDGQVVECSLAKPQTEQKTSGGSNSQKAAIFPSYPPRMEYGLIGSPYGALGAGYSGAGFAQPMIYGRGAAPGMAMMPMILPDGRVGYVLCNSQVCSHTPHHRFKEVEGAAMAEAIRVGEDVTVVVGAAVIILISLPRLALPRKINLCMLPLACNDTVERLINDIKGA